VFADPFARARLVSASLLSGDFRLETVVSPNRKPEAMRRRRVSALARMVDGIVKIGTKLPWAILVEFFVFSLRILEYGSFGFLRVSIPSLGEKCVLPL
jgi:hypothetical protein